MSSTIDKLVEEAPAQSASARRDWMLSALPVFALLCLAAYCLLGAALISMGSAKWLTNPGENTYPENTNVYAAIHTARTGQLYTVPSQPPYVLQPFGPLYYLLNSEIARASHLDFDLTQMRARLVSYACYLLSALLVFLICRRLRFSVIYSALAALLFLGQPIFVYWNASSRPDVPFLMVMLLSLLFTVNVDADGAGGYFLAGILAGLAFLIKQPGFAVFAAVAGVLLFRKTFRQAAIYIAGAGLPVVLVVGVLLWGRGPFLEQFTSVGKGLWSVRDGALFAYKKLDDVMMLVPILAGVIGFAQAIQGEAASQMVAAFAVANWFFGLSGLPQLGSDINYFLPGLTSCALLLPYAIEWMRTNAGRKVVFAVIGLGLLWATSQEMDRAHKLLSIPVQQANLSYAALAPFKILSDRTIFSVHGRDPDLLDPYTAHELELGGHWNGTPIVENVQRGDYDLIILAGSWEWHVVNNFRGVSYFSPELVQTINENYVVVCSTLTSVALRPRSREVEITPVTLGQVLGQPCGMGMHGRAPKLIIPAGAR